MMADVTLSGDQSRPCFWSWTTCAGLAITLAILACLCVTLDVSEIWRQVIAANLLWVALGGLAHYATYVVRGARWRLCLLHVKPHAGIGKFSLLMFFVNAVDNIVPAKLSDIYAAHLAGINCGVGRTSALGSIVCLRVVDAWFVLGLAGLASGRLFAVSLPQSVLWSLMLGGCLALLATGIMLFCWLFRTVLPTWLPQRIYPILQALHVGMWPRPRYWGPIAILTVVIWAFETLWIVSLTVAFGIQISFFEGLFLTAIPLLASAFPLTPSGAGVVELTLFSCLRLLDVPAPTAASVTVVNRLIDYWLHMGLGAVTWSIRDVIGLRTWREVPLGDTQRATPQR